MEGPLDAVSARSRCLTPAHSNRSPRGRRELRLGTRRTSGLSVRPLAVRGVWGDVWQPPARWLVIRAPGSVADGLGWLSSD